MSYIDLDLIGERLNRMVKLALDTGEAATIEEAEALFAGYRLHVDVGCEAAATPAGQATLLTIINTSRRTFLGGVSVQGNVDVPLTVALPGHVRLDEALRGLGATIAAERPIGVPVIVVGEAEAIETDGFAIRAVAGGWCGGCVAVNDPLQLDASFTITPAAVLAGALAVSEAFQHVRQVTPAAGRRRVGLSLWRPERDWLDDEAIGIGVERWPASAWLIGLGNLGQACLWTLGLLPYADPGQVKLVLQDFDHIAISNESTSMLTRVKMAGQRKTRAMAAWCEARGFDVRLVERRFANDFTIAADEPAVALCGVDNAHARRALEDVGFTRVIEAGLGRGTSDFMALRLHSFPGPARARQLWTSRDTQMHRLDQPAYEAMREEGADRCGLTRLAGRTVGAPFVGAIAATLMIAELVRLVNGAHNYALVDAHLRALEHRTAVEQSPDFACNPGSTT